MSIRKAHRNLYRLVTTVGATFVALGLNFLLLNPTFRIFDQDNWPWGVAFLVLGAGQLLALNFNRTELLRIFMSASVGYNLVLMLGTAQPAAVGLGLFEGELSGSLQLPIVYAALAAIQIPLLLEPFTNPASAAARNGS